MGCDKVCGENCPKNNTEQILKFFEENNFDFKNPTKKACEEIRENLKAFLEQAGIKDCPSCLSNVFENIFPEDSSF